VWKIKFIGRAKNISREEARAWVWASLTVLGYHNFCPIVPALTYHFKSKLNDKDDCGLAYRAIGKAEIKNGMEDQETFTTILHETIHLCIEFPAGTVEACTTKLCAKIKRDVADIAFALVEGTYKRAAALAHCKISYPPKNGQEDYYDSAEDRFVCWAGDQYRGKRSKKGGK